MQFVGKAESLSASGLAAAASLLGCEIEALLAVIEVETAGCGFLRDKRPVILFERHVFSKLTNGRFDGGEHQNVSAPVPGSYGASGAHQYDRLDQAMALDEDAALKSASWGLGQIMGYNAEVVGYRTHGVRGMISTFADSEDAQVMAVAQYCLKRGLDDELRRLDWLGFASVYNGPAFRKNLYDSRLAQAYASIKEGSLRPDLAVRTEQLRLMFAGFYRGRVDGLDGPQTMAARLAAAA